MSKIDSLRNILSTERDRFDKESTKHKHLYRNCRYTVFALTALTALAASLALWATSYQMHLNTLVVATSAIIGIVTSIEGIRKPQELWILERNIYYSLRDFERELEYNGHKLTDAQLDQLFQEIQGLLGASKEKWGQYVAPVHGTGTQPTVSNMNEKSISATSFDKMVRRTYGSAIDEYARGSQQLETHAIRQCYPAIAALNLDEAYATLVITARMDALLGKMIAHGAVRQGNASKFLKPLSFAAKTNMAYVFGFLSERMRDAIDASRGIRNAYAHAESPEDARNDPGYQTNKSKLLSLDPAFVNASIDKMRESLSSDKSFDDDRIGITAVMVEICDSLDNVAAMNQLCAAKIKPKVVPAIFGFECPVSEDEI